MPIDPSIILAATQKPLIDIKQPDQLEEYGKALRLKALMGQQSLQDLQMRQARQGLEDEQAQRDAMIASAGDNKRYRELLANRGQHKAVAAIDKQLLDTEKTRSDIEKNNAETASKRMAQHRDQLAGVTDRQTAAAWVADAYNDPILGPRNKQPGQLERMISSIPEDPQAFNQWRQQMALGAAKYIEANKPTIHMQDTGGASNIVSIPGLGGAPQIISTTQKTQTPDSIASNATTRRGQDMTDARAREQIAAGRVPSGYRANPDGTLVAIPGGPADESRKPLTESQGKAAGLLHRATRANQLLNDAEDLGETNRGIIKQGAGAVPLVGGALEMGVNMLPGALGGPSANQQKIEQARRDFVNAALRVESGASISASEFANAEKQYFPMPGDSPEVIKQKREARQAELEALRMQSGPSAIARGLRPALAGNPAPAAGGVKFLGFE